MKITVSDFLNPLPDDPVFRCLSDAIVHAKKESQHDGNDPRAVWIDDELHCVFLRGYELRPV